MSKSHVACIWDMRNHTVVNQVIVTSYEEWLTAKDNLDSSKPWLAIEVIKELYYTEQNGFTPEEVEEYNKSM